MAYVSEIERLERQFNDKPEQYFAPLADQYRKAGNIDLALEVLKANLEKRPNWVSAHIVLGRCYLDQKNDGEAAKAFEHILQLDAENIIALKFLGEIAERMGDPEGAYRWVKRLLEVDPMNDDAQEALKRLEPAAGAMPAAVAMPAASAPTTEIPAVKAEPEPEPAAVSGFEPTSVDGSPPAAVPEAGDIERVDRLSLALSSATAMPDIGIERSESAIEAPPPAAAAIELEPLSEIPEPEPPPPPPPPPSDELELAEDITLQPAPSADLPVETSSPVGDLVSLEEPAASPTASLPLVAYEPEPAAPPAAPAAPAPRASASLRMPSDLPLIMPEESPEAAPPPVAPPPAREEATGTEPEPVITETMAEVYLRQGLVTEARDVYRQLVQKRPDDAGLRARMEALEQRSAAARERPTPARTGRRFIAGETGGRSARSFLSEVLSARPAPATGERDGGTGEPPSRGAPSRPTGEAFSLASVFGEEPAPAAPSPPPAAAPAPAASAPATGFSFDEFFGGKKTEPAAAPSPPPAPPPPEGDGNRDDFVSWLKGLKS